MYCLNQNQFYANDSVHSSLTCSLTSNGATTNESGEEWFMRQNMQSFGHSPHGNIINYPLLSIEEEAFWQYSPPSHSSPIGHQPSIQSIPTLLQQQAPFQPQYMYQQPFVPPPVQYQQPPSHHHCDLELLSRMQMAKNSTDDIYEVSFKRHSKEFISGIQMHVAIKIGDAVIVAAERGEDFGIVTRIIPKQEYLNARFQNVHLPNFNLLTYVGRIFRLANEWECQQFGQKIRDEEEVFQFAVHLAANVYRIDMQVIDVEFQFDRQKLTIFYEAKTRVNFRELVNELHCTFNARVWMERIH